MTDAQERISKVKEVMEVAIAGAVEEATPAAIDLVAKEVWTTGLTWATLLREALTEEGFVVRLHVYEAALAQAKVCKCGDCSKVDIKPPYAQETVGPRAWERWRRLWHSARILWPPLRRSAAQATMTEEEEVAALAKAYRHTGDIPPAPPHRKGQGPTCKAYKVPGSAALGATAKAMPRRGAKKREVPGTWDLDAGTSRPSTTTPSTKRYQDGPTCEVRSKKPRKASVGSGQGSGAVAQRQIVCGGLTLTLKARGGAGSASRPAQH